MDLSQFELDVLESVNCSFYTEQWGAMDETGYVVTIGETHPGALYGLEEYEDGYRYFHLFDTESVQRDWFESEITS